MQGRRAWGVRPVFGRGAREQAHGKILQDTVHACVCAHLGACALFRSTCTLPLAPAGPDGLRMPTGAWLWSRLAEHEAAPRRCYGAAIATRGAHKNCQPPTTLIQALASRPSSADLGRHRRSDHQKQPAHHQLRLIYVKQICPICGQSFITTLQEGFVCGPCWRRWAAGRCFRSARRCWSHLPPAPCSRWQIKLVCEWRKIQHVRARPS